MTVSNGKSAALVLSELMLNVMGSRKKHGNPEIHSKQLNDELDRHYHKALAALEEIIIAAKPEVRVFDDGINDATYFQQKIADQYEQNIRQAFSNGEKQS